MSHSSGGKPTSDTEAVQFRTNAEQINTLSHSDFLGQNPKPTLSEHEHDTSLYAGRATYEHRLHHVPLQQDDIIDALDEIHQLCLAKWLS